MFLKRISLLLALAVAAVLASAVAPAARHPATRPSSSATRCAAATAWSVNGGAFKASQTMTLRRGGSFAVTDNDVMPHKLVLTSGPRCASRIRCSATWARRRRSR